MSQVLVRLLMRRARVVSSEALAERFSLVTLEGPELAGAAWTPGQKIQVAMGSAFVARTYTPMAWEASGRTSFLGYAHGDGLGADWLRSLEPGVECDIFGPRASLDVEGGAGPLAVFGDETSMGLAYALAMQDPARSVACAFEVTDLDAAAQVADRLGLSRAALFRRRADDAHLETMTDALASLSGVGASFVLTGRAGAIQRVRNDLKARGVAPRRLLAKAYWAPGKTGLD
ncbi:siderophore-interacting protein [Caulobacter radicis]|uniref:siderophore-interacting protein n=1 Tax=Caulobacter radicis TaxID=2172650 RepID=UPI001AD7E92F|nr:SIP domain-containing protein [Caulobacter radicis]